ncbi:ImuA family protein [Paenirhodobacter sp.]|uniref:ImuA family protein n=1 Tax=Paenirhodobacter sp. TaxID=1965326 RepID=UPI003B50A806
MAMQLTAFPLRPARVHEACGPLAPSFAAAAGAQTGHVLWLRESWRNEQINPLALSAYLDPAQILLITTRDQNETLAVAEEGLRDEISGLVVLELTAPIGLTVGRRLQLAAQAGKTTGLCLISEGMGSPAAETRWRCSAVRDAGATPRDSTLQCWELIKNKSGTIGSWHVRWSHSARRLSVVSPAGD